MRGDKAERVFEPAYRRLSRVGALAERAREAWRRLKDCDLCARNCHVDRIANFRGAVCRTGERAIVHSAGPHHGEEDCLRGTPRLGHDLPSLQYALRLLPELGHQLAWRRARGLDRRTRRHDAQATDVGSPQHQFCDPEPRCRPDHRRGRLGGGPGPIFASALQHRRLRQRGSARPAGRRDRHLHARHEIRRC